MWARTGSAAVFDAITGPSRNVLEGALPRRGTAMTVDYDTPRNADIDEMGEDSLGHLNARRNVASSSAIDTDESESTESFELPDVDIPADELLLVRVLPKQSDEFTCSSCFLVHHRSRLAGDKGGRLICTECAA
jgi:Domain of unknown function (DUF4193)